MKRNVNKQTPDDQLETDGAPEQADTKDMKNLHPAVGQIKAVAESDRFDSAYGSLEGTTSLNVNTTSFRSELGSITETEKSSVSSEDVNVTACKTDYDSCSEALSKNLEELVLADEGIDDTSSLELFGTAEECSICTGEDKINVEALEIFEQDEDGDTKLHLAIIQMEYLVIERFLNLAPSPLYLNMYNCLIQTPLHLAALTRQRDVVRRLMVGGANLEQRDRKGNTALHIACRDGFTDVVNTLLEPVTYEETRENTYEIEYQKIPQDLEIRNYDGFTCFHLAAENMHFGVIRNLLTRGTDVNAADGKSGRTVLHVAAETGNILLITFLLEQPRINVNTETYAGITPVMLARGRGYPDIVDILSESDTFSGDSLPWSDSDSSDGDR